MRITWLVSVGALVALSGPAAASPPAPPCDGCVVVMPAATTAPTPLLVVIPDRGETPEHAADRWRAAALDRRWGVLALACPIAARCRDGAWSSYQGSPRWLTDVIGTLDRTHSVDQARTYLIGVGDGATFVGARAPMWRAFAAIVVEAGGAPARSCPPGTLPAYFVGDGGARLEHYYERCEQEYRRGPTGDARAVLDWLGTHARPILVSGA